MQMTAKQRKANLAQDYKATFGTESGKRVIRDMMKRFGVLGTDFDPDCATNAFKMGERNPVFFIMNMVHMTPDELDSMYDQVKIEQLNWSVENGKTQ